MKLKDFTVPNDRWPHIHYRIHNGRIQDGWIRQKDPKWQNIRLDEDDPLLYNKIIDAYFREVLKTL